MRAFLLSLAALRDNHTHSDIQVVSTCPRPALSPCVGECWGHSACGARLSSDRDDAE